MEKTRRQLDILTQGKRGGGHTECSHPAVSGVKMTVETRAELPNGSQGSQSLRESQPQIAGLKNRPRQLGQSPSAEAANGKAAMSFYAGRWHHLIDTERDSVGHTFGNCFPRRL